MNRELLTQTIQDAGWRVRERISTFARHPTASNRSFTVGYLCALREVGLLGCDTYTYLLALCGQIVDNPEVLGMVREELS